MPLRLTAAADRGYGRRRFRSLEEEGVTIQRFISARRVAAALALVAALSAVVVGVVASPATGSAVGNCTAGSGWPASRADLAQQVVSLVNSHRQSLGLAALHVSPTLTSSAVWKSQHMAEYGYMQHDDPAPPVARTVPQRLDACGYPADTTGWGENIAYGFQTAQAVMNAWLNSSGHKANIENPTYRAIGVGAAVAPNGYVYWTQDFGTYDDSGTAGGGGGGGTSAPTVTLTSAPAAQTTATSASFAWTTGGTVSATTCSLDGAAAVACSSPKSYTGLGTGTHTFRVTVSNSGGSSAAGYSWSVAASTPPPPQVPSVRITSAPASSTSTSATFGWSTTGTVSTTTCSLDGGPAVACTSPKSYGGLSTGSHTFRVTVANAAGAASAAYSWSVTPTRYCWYRWCF